MDFGLWQFILRQIPHFRPRACVIAMLIPWWYLDKGWRLRNQEMLVYNLARRVCIVVNYHQTKSFIIGWIIGGRVQWNELSTIFEWYLAGFVTMNMHCKDICYGEVGLGAQNIHTIINLTMNKIGRVLVIAQKERNFVSHFHYEMWNDSLHELYLLTRSDKSRSCSTTKFCQWTCQFINGTIGSHVLR